MVSDALLALVAVFPALILWNTRFRALSAFLAADFSVFFAVDEIWLTSSLPGGTWFLPVKGLIYIMFFMIYLTRYRDNTALSLGILSAIIGVMHCSNGILMHYGIGLTEGNYELIMGAYCVLQLIVFYVGTGYAILHSNSDNMFSSSLGSDHSKRAT